MGIRDFVKRKRAEHGGLRRYAASKLSGQEPAAADEAPSSPTPSAPVDAALPEAPDAEGRRAVGPSSQVAEGGARSYRLGDEAVAVFRAGGQLYAVDAACTHEDGPLDEGRVEGLVVTCPYHDWRFSLESGECLSHPDRAVACYAVAEAQGFIWVGARTSEGATERGGAHDDGLATLVREV